MCDPRYVPPRYRRAGTVLDRLDEVGIGYVAFKGIALIAGLYRNAATRMLSDIDVLVRREDLGAFEDAVASLGFRRWPRFQGISFETWEARLAEHERTRNPAFDYVDDTETDLDVHTGFGFHSATARRPPGN